MKPFDFESMCRDEGIEVATEGHKHCRPGWLQVPCPFCSGNEGFHLGYNIRTGHFNCWRCGWHPAELVVAEILHCGRLEASTRIGEYRVHVDKNENKAPVHAKDCLLPAGWLPLRQCKKHQRYLERRGFKDPLALAETWSLVGTERLGPLPWRLVAPVILNGQLVSYQTRDITGAASVPYKACAEEKEAIHHKHLLYGEELVPADRIVIVEGIVDAWKLGPGAVSTFGIGYSIQQVKRLARFKHKVILYDSDPKGEGQTAARKLASTLMGLAGTVEVVTLQLKKGQKDPGDLDEDEAHEIMRRLL